MAELVKDLVLVSLGMGIGVVIMCIVQVGKMADEGMKNIETESFLYNLNQGVDQRKYLK